jgi:DNA-binding transcriptional regulator YhcF (GntR family)
MARQLETVSTVEALERELERQILDGVFAPGEHLREVELSESYEVGRHTLRAAFDRLVRRGVLDKARNRGVFVREFTPQDVTEIYEVRTALEVQAFRMLAARRTVPPAAREATERCRPDRRGGSSGRPTSPSIERSSSAPGTSGSRAPTKSWRPRSSSASPSSPAITPRQTSWRRSTTCYWRRSRAASRPRPRPRSASTSRGPAAGFSTTRPPALQGRPTGKRLLGD